MSWKLLFINDNLSKTYKKEYRIHSIRRLIIQSTLKLFLQHNTISTFFLFIFRPFAHHNANRDYRIRRENNILKNNLVPFAVLGVAFLFFIVVAVMYLGIRSDSSALDTSGKRPWWFFFAVTEKGRALEKSFSCFIIFVVRKERFLTSVGFL